MDSPSGPWSSLALGQRFRVKSVRGNPYEASFLTAGPEEAGLYVRLAADGKLARLSPDRLDWTTLEPGESSDALAPGDEVLATPSGGVEQRGRLMEPADERLTLQLAAGAVLQVPLHRLEQLRLLFASTDLRRGDEFMVKSASGASTAASRSRSRPTGSRPRSIDTRVRRSRSASSVSTCARCAS